MSIAARRTAGVARRTPSWRAAAGRRPRVSRQVGLATAAVATYVLLWIVEGAFRKWLPATGTVMYVARDVALAGFVIVQYALAPKRRSALPSLLFWGLVGLLLVLAAAQVVVVQAPLAVTLLGLRNYLAPIAFAYFFWRFWRPQGGLLARMLLLAVPLELAVTALQVVSPASAFINVATNGAGTGLGNGDVVRGSGTFSDAGTLATFATIVFALCLGLLADPRRDLRRRWLYLALLGTLLMMAIAGERTAVFGSAAVLLVWLAREVLRAELRSLAVAGSVIAGGAIVLLAALVLYPAALANFGTRFVQANQQEDSTGRVIGAAVGFLSVPLTPLGDGAGSHSNAALALGTGTDWIELELNRWVAELGIVGLILVLARIAIGLLLGFRVLTGLTTLPALAVTMSCVVGPQLVAGSISVNPAIEGAAAMAFALLIWSFGGTSATATGPRWGPGRAVGAPR